jgi:hypothetical protein
MMRILFATFFMLFCSSLFCADNSRQMETQDLLEAPKALNLALLKAIKENNLEDVKNALLAGASPDAEGERGLSALHFACTKKKSEIAKLLLEKQADPNKIVKILSPDLSVLERSILGMAVKNKEWEIVFLLIEHKAKLQLCDPPEYGHKIEKKQAKLKKKQAKLEKKQAKIII